MSKHLGWLWATPRTTQLTGIHKNHPIEVHKTNPENYRKPTTHLVELALLEQEHAVKVSSLGLPPLALARAYIFLLQQARAALHNGVWNSHT